MSTQTVTGHSFPTPCKRCGGALYRQVDYCPYCGAVHPLDPDPHPHQRAVIPGSRASATHKPLHQLDGELDAPDVLNDSGPVAHPMQPEEALPEVPVMRTALVSPDTPIPPLEEPLYVPRSPVLTIRRVLYLIGALVVIGLAYVGYALLSDTSDSEDTDFETITQDARTTTTGTIAPFASAPSAIRSQAAHSFAAVRPATPAMPAAPATTATPDIPARLAPVVPAAPVAPVAPLVAATPAKPPLQFRDAAQALDAARLALRANDLSKAQAALAAAQTLQPGNTDAKDLAAQLRPLAERRDNALQAAQACVAQQSWPCARQHANEALAIDSNNDTARSVLERVIRETGWAPLNPRTTPRRD
ncbi:hypothetical protein [Paraburkholderia susongensis]|uniref:Tetratricopeptide repeat-containing protein n=1 Tax=Paraburkholderia susongensis TaxID=1515439 RepID=A0A1X7M1H9_9BURK|nr:hypothetical protein [Paraburkholderia susongensis]SMG59199.1 hypothetical protein SAMN06265784_112170 [Paraburkholderia susongensis]